MRRALFAATAFLSLAPTGQTALAADDAPEAPYVDDRSSADAVIRSLYSAINRHEFARAWGYFGETKPAKDFDSFVKGFDGTDKVEVETGSVSDEGAAGSIFYNVPVAIRATDKTGGEKVFAGCYTLRQVNAQIQAAPPFDPIPQALGEEVELFLLRLKGSLDRLLVRSRHQCARIEIGEE